MATITFDTHAFVKRLTATGMPEAQAEVVTAIVTEARETDRDHVATKADVERVEHKLELLKGELELLKRDMTIRLGAMIAALATIILAAIRYLPPHP